MRTWDKTKDAMPVEVPLTYPEAPETPYVLQFERYGGSDNHIGAAALVCNVTGRVIKRIEFDPVVGMVAAKNRIMKAADMRVVIDKRRGATWAQGINEYEILKGLGK